MFNYFTTWNMVMLCCPRFTSTNSRALLALSSCISFSGLVMLVDSYKKKCWRWKDFDITWYEYLMLELNCHQAPFLILLGMKPTGNALTALFPVSLYCIFFENRYKLGKHKLKNWYGMLMIGCAAPLVNYLTRKPNLSICR